MSGNKSDCLNKKKNYYHYLSVKFIVAIVFNFN